MSTVTWGLFPKLLASVGQSSDVLAPNMPSAFLTQPLSILIVSLKGILQDGPFYWESTKYIQCPSKRAQNCKPGDWAVGLVSPAM